MPRRNSVPVRDVLPDPIYGSKVITKFVNQIMWDGKKGTAQSIVYGAFEIIEQKSGMAAMEVFNKAMENVMPSLEVKARRVGVPHTRCLWKSVRQEDRLSLSDGLLCSRVKGAKRPW